jgi:hypothetical protein
MSSDLHFAEAVRILASLNDMCRDENVSGYMTPDVITSYKSLIMDEIDRMVRANNYNIIINNSGFRELASRFRDEPETLGQDIYTRNVTIRTPTRENHRETQRLRDAISSGNVAVRTPRRQIDHEPVQIYQSEMISEPSLPNRYNPIERTVVIAKRKLQEPCPSVCAICQETPKYKDVVCTECDHYYCKTCWNDWMNAELSNKNCPTCRREMPVTTSYRSRVSRLRSRQQINP